MLNERATVCQTRLGVSGGTGKGDGAFYPRGRFAVQSGSLLGVCYRPCLVTLIATSKKTLMETRRDSPG